MTTKTLENGFEILPPTNDWIFKLLFGDERNKSMLVNLLQSFVELPQEEFELTFLDSHLKKEFEEDKLGIVDIKIKTASGKIINIEIQVNPVNFIGERLSFYKSKLIAEQIGEGEKYDVIQKVICICITSYTLFPGKQEYINVFRYYNPKNNLLFEAIPEEIITLEIPKLPLYSDGSTLYDWLLFLRSNTKEDFEMIAEKNPEIRKAVDTLYKISTDEKARSVYELRMKSWRDQQSALHYATTKGRTEGLTEGLVKGREEGRTEEKHEIAQKMKDRGLSAEDILAVTGIHI